MFGFTFIVTSDPPISNERTAEVRSRLNGDASGAEMSRLPRFLSMMSVLGFECVERDARKGNKFFILMVFRKAGESKGKEKDVEGGGSFLKPCIYKRR